MQFILIYANMGRFLFRAIFVWGCEASAAHKQREEIALDMLHLHLNMQTVQFSMSLI